MTMRVLCAPDSFKETLSAADAAAALAAGAEQAGAGVIAQRVPVADGGEGTLDILAPTMDAVVHAATVTGPRGQPVAARYAVQRAGPNAIVELAEASGLALVPVDDRDPTRTTTYGTGELIVRAAGAGATRVLLTIGGSATCDGGAGIAQALGARFFDDRGGVLTEPLAGGTIGRIRHAERPPRVPELRLACDVDNPLCGPRGAAAVYGPQKGATPEQVERLDAALATLAGVLGVDPNTPGLGAAGGVGLALTWLGAARLERGIDLVLEMLGFAERCRDADLVLTGEGRLDRQSLHGKACLGIAAVAATHGVPTIAIVGAAGEGADECVGDGRLSGYVSLSERYGRERAMSETAAVLAEAAREVVSGRR
ncbi:MAG: glycerate kinase [Planctomycetes bacterium]|nr:glycerate kinase [Planctomycetota bacterium]